MERTNILERLIERIRGKDLSKNYEELIFDENKDFVDSYLMFKDLFKEIQTHLEEDYYQADEF